MSSSNGHDRERAELVMLALAVAPERRRDWVLSAPAPALAAYVAGMTAARPEPPNEDPNPTS